MFAPPPVQLSRTEVEARLAAKRRNAADNDPAINSLHGNESPISASPKVHRAFSRGNKIKVSAPIATNSQSIAEVSKQRSGVFKFTAGEVVESTDLPSDFAEHPRKAPAPPRRSTRPPSEWFEVRPRVHPARLTPEEEELPPPVPAKSPKRLRGLSELHSIESSNDAWPPAEPSVSGTLSNEAVENGTLKSESEHSKHRPRSFESSGVRIPDDDILMPGPRPTGIVSRGASPFSFDSIDAKVRPVFREGAMRSGVKGAKIHKPDAKGSLSYTSDNLNVQIRVNLPPPLKFLNKDLPATPTSIMSTPTDMYQCVPPRPTRLVVRKHKRENKRKSPLGQVSVVNAKTNSILEEAEQASPNKLPAIPEYGTMSENSPPSPSPTSPVKTQIHLKGGSVVTVSPPEMTAWQQRTYLQGPIKLPKPVIVPRKDSIASLEPFQEAIDQVYQEALNITRRRSDESVEEDVCDFFDDFGFDDISFEGDLLGVEGIDLDEVKEADEVDAEELEQNGVSLAEQTPSPVEKVIAKEIVEASITPRPAIPPVENEATLRARGIARLSSRAMAQSSTSPKERKDSLTLSKPGGVVLPLLPLPEESILDTHVEPAQEDHVDRVVSQPVDQGFDWDDVNVEELDGGSSWLGPGSHLKSRNPVKRMRRFVATASAIL